MTALAQMALRRPESVLAVLSELDPMSDVGPASLDEVYDVLSERLGFLRGQATQTPLWPGFRGLDDEEAQGRSFDVVFLPRAWQKGLISKAVFGRSTSAG